MPPVAVAEAGRLRGCNWSPNFTGDNRFERGEYGGFEGAEVVTAAAAVASEVTDFQFEPWAATTAAAIAAEVTVTFPEAEETEIGA